MMGEKSYEMNAGCGHSSEKVGLEQEPVTMANETTVAFSKSNEEWVSRKKQCSTM